MFHPGEVVAHTEAVVITAQALRRRIAYLRGELSRRDVASVPDLAQELRSELEALLRDPVGPRAVG